MSVNSCLGLKHDEAVTKKCEKTTRIIQRRGIWTTTEIKKGEKFTKDNLDVLRPCVGLPASDFSKLLSKKARKNYLAFTALK